MTVPPPFPPGSAVVAYLRDSGGSEQDLSVDQQLEVLTRYCAEYGLALSRVFADRATPGSTVVGREQFQKMISHFHSTERAESAVILWKYSRFSRDLDDAAFYKADLRRRGVSIHSINDNIPDGNDGRLFENLIDWMNARFLEDLSSDVKRGLKHLLENYGALPGTPPRGFKREPVVIGTRRDGTAHTASRWVPDPETLEICKKAWRMRASGAAIRKIHEETHLFANRSSYNAFYRNRIYLGELHYGEIVLPGYVEAMVDLNTWDQVQKLNRENATENDPLRSRHHPRRVNSRYLLSGVAYCLKCGALMSGKTVMFQGKVQREYYQCTNAAARMNCDAKRIPAPALDKLVAEKLLEYVLDPAGILERARQLSQGEEQRKERLKEDRVALSTRLNDTRKRIKTLVERIAEDENSPRSLISALKELEALETDLQLRLVQNKDDQDELANSVRTMEQATLLVDTFHERWNSQDLETRRGVVNVLIRKVTCEREGPALYGMVHFYNPTMEQIKKQLPSEDEKLPMWWCLHGDPIHRQTHVINFKAKIKYNRILNYTLECPSEPTGSP